MLGGGNWMMTDLSKATGLSFAEIQAARLSGKSMAQLLTEKGKDVKAYIAQEVAARKTSLDQLVSAGRITKDQADLALKNFQANIEANMNRTTTGPNGQRGGMMNGTGTQGRGMGRWSR
jgi:hypothetical protein